MQKFLFFDYREIESMSGFTRIPERVVKHGGNPLFLADESWENGNMQLYGSVVKAEGRPFQLWYSVIHRPWQMYLAYAESPDGIVWEKKQYDIFTHEGMRTNIIFTQNPHGPAVIYDADDPREEWRYKMVAGVDPSRCITTFRSPDGIRWTPVRRFPSVGTKPDCPMGFLRAPDGRYVIYHRLQGFFRRVFRSESWDFVYWTGEPRMVLEPDAGDPPNVQFYGMGSAPYGPYEIGTLWIYTTDPNDLGRKNMMGYQDAELTYARSGYAWHRVAQGDRFIPRGGADAWDRGNLQCASAPVYLDDEIRYYYMGTDVTHRKHWELDPQHAGLGMASIKPDRFVALGAGEDPAELMTVAVTLESQEISINANIAAGGSVRVALLESDGTPIEGFSQADCVSLSGDGNAHRVRWRGAAAPPTDRPVRIRIHASKARLYSVSVGGTGTGTEYHRFDAAKL